VDVAIADVRDEALLLDLLNTTPVVDGVVTDVLAESEAAAEWMREHAVAATGVELEGLLAARAALQAVVRGSARPSELRPFLDAATLRPTVTADGAEWRLVVDDGPHAAVRAVLAWNSLRTSSPGRLRPCANPECRLFLIDRSRPNTARWCSMALCGNRMKARRHYRRTHSLEAD
jgi:predicted RNA-binding Zn ribbon-like protein